jgi:hypothetical protein
MPETRPYQRGTKIERRTTARLQPGDEVLTEWNTGGTFLHPAYTKTTSYVRTVARVEAFTPPAGEHWRGRRQGGRRTVVFTDGESARNLAAHETWPLVVPAS